MNNLNIKNNLSNIFENNCKELPDLALIKDKRVNPDTMLFSGEIDRTEEFIQKIKDGQIKPNITDGYGWGYLHYAAIRNNTDVINALVKNGNDVNIKDRDLKTPLFHAIIFLSLDAIKELLNLGANPMLRDIDGNHCLFLAEGKNNPELNNILNLEERKKTEDIYKNEVLEKRIKNFLEQSLKKRIK